MIDKILGGRYEILEEIGKGGMAIVYKARCRLLNRIVAVKVLRDDLYGSEEFIKRFNVEAQAAASLAHPNIVSIYDVGTENNIHYIVMEYVEGKTLKKHIEEKSFIPWKKAIEIGLEICSALGAAHKKHIVHRDIKPHNIIIAESGTIKVTDFGIARASTSATMTADDDVLGSVHYFSPEQARGGYVDEKSDIYSLGVLMYEMLSGKVPFDGDTPVAIAMKHLEEVVPDISSEYQNIPKSVETVVFKAMSKDTRQRYQTVEEMAKDLKEILNDPLFIPTKASISDTAQTKKMPSLKKEVTFNVRDGKLYVNNGDDTMKNNNYEKPKTLKSDKKTIVFAVITSLIIVSVLSVFAMYMLGMGGAKGTLMVPSLVGKSLEEAKEIADDEGFTIKIEKYQESNEADDTVLSQDPKEKQIVNSAGIIKVIVSGIDEKELITLKDFRNKKSRDSKIELENDDIMVVEIEEPSAIVSKGYIIKQDPKSGTKIKPGSKVTFYVSTGPDQDMQVSVPNLLGKSESEARRALEEVNLTLGSVSEVDSDKPKGEVISQGLQGYVNEKTAVNITVSSGKKANDSNTTNQTNPNNPNQTTPAITPKPNKTKTIGIDLSQYNSTVKIDIVANGKTVYSSTQDASVNNDFSATVSGSGTVNFDIYIDGVRVGSRTVNFDK